MGLFDRWTKRYKYENTRQYLRLPTTWPVKCEPQTLQDNKFLYRTKDISAGGVSLHVQEMIPAGTLLQLEIHVPPLGRSVSARGQVVRCLPGRRTGFDLGIRFLEIDPKDRRALNDAVEQLLPPGQKAAQKRPWWRKLPGTQ